VGQAEVREPPAGLAARSGSQWEEVSVSHPPADRARGTHGGGVGERDRDPWSGAQPALVNLDRVEVLVFTVGGHDHALPVEDVIEVVRMVAVTPLPEAPAWVAGVINMRGRIIPVIDLRTRLGLPPREPDLSTPIIIVGGSEAAAGLVADAAGEVLALPSAVVESPHRVPTPVPAVSGVVRQGDRLILLLDSRRLCEGSTHLAAPTGGDATDGEARAGATG
jgi:purine-binding chemotaxis protein CheW